MDTNEFNDKFGYILNLPNTQIMKMFDELLIAKQICCPICKGTNLQVHGYDPRGSDYCVIVICKECSKGKFVRDFYIPKLNEVMYELKKKEIMGSK